MKQEQIRESIRLNTEFLKFYFILLLGVGTGFLTLAAKEDYTIKTLILMSLGVAAFVVILILIFTTNRKIKRLIALVS